MNRLSLGSGRYSDLLRSNRLAAYRLRRVPKKLEQLVCFISISRVSRLSNVSSTAVPNPAGLVRSQMLAEKRGNLPGIKRLPGEFRGCVVTTRKPDDIQRQIVSLHFG